MIGSPNQDNEDMELNRNEWKRFELMSQQLAEIAEEQLKLARAIEKACTEDSSGRPVDALRRTLETVPMPQLKLWEPFRADYPTGVAACYLRTLSAIMSAASKASRQRDTKRLQHLSEVMHSFAYDALMLIDEIECNEKLEAEDS